MDLRKADAAFCGAGEGRAMSSQVVTYRVDDATTVKMDIDPVEGFPASGSW